MVSDPASGTEVKKMSSARLQELEETAASLFAAASALPLGPQRDEALREIEGFRVQIAALHRVDARLAEVGLRAEN
jgi:hypothetical protein